MKLVLSVRAMRDSDAYTIRNRVGSRELMFRAGNAVYEKLREMFEPCSSKIAVVCGSGNNAGDGFVISRLLHENGFDCTLLTTSEVSSEDGGHYYRECLTSGVGIRHIPDLSSVPDFSGFGVIVDCLLGTGYRGPLRKMTRSVIEAINRAADAFVVSVDINSGLNGDGGLSQEEDVCVISDLTVSIGALKPGHLIGRAKDVIRQCVNVDIGIVPTEECIFLLEPEDFKGIFAKRRNLSNKATYGYLALIGGSLEYSGAVRLAAQANAAMRSGAGVVRLAAPVEICHALLPEILEVTLFPLGDGEDLRPENRKKELKQLLSNTRTVAFGMGIGVSEDSEFILRYLLENYDGNLIVDADGLTLLSQLEPGVVNRRFCSLILTPHVKEMARLLHGSVDEILKNPIEAARTAARKFSAAPGVDRASGAEVERECIVLLKGPTTIVTDGEVSFLTDAGCPGMATAGSGDVLSGILSAVCANIQNMSLDDSRAGDLRAADCGSAGRSVHDYCPGAAPTFRSIGSYLLKGAALAAFINGKAGECAQKKYGEISMIASDTVAQIPAIIKELSL